MVNVTNRTDVAMRLIPLKLFLGHGSLHLLLSPKTDVPSGAVKPAKVQQRARNIAKFRAVQARKPLYGAFVTDL
jgi:hypothetical protein